MPKFLRYVRNRWLKYRSWQEAKKITKWIRSALGIVWAILNSSFICELEHIIRKLVASCIEPEKVCRTYESDEISRLQNEKQPWRNDGLMGHTLKANDATILQHVEIFFNLLQFGESCFTSRRLRNSKQESAWNQVLPWQLAKQMYFLRCRWCARFNIAGTTFTPLMLMYFQRCPAHDVVSAWTWTYWLVMKIQMLYMISSACT